MGIKDQQPEKIKMTTLGIWWTFQVYVNPKASKKTKKMTNKT